MPHLPSPLPVGPAGWGVQGLKTGSSCDPWGPSCWWALSLSLLSQLPKPAFKSRSSFSGALLFPLSSELTGKRELCCSVPRSPLLQPRWLLFEPHKGVSRCSAQMCPLPCHPAELGSSIPAAGVSRVGREGRGRDRRRRQGGRERCPPTSSLEPRSELLILWAGGKGLFNEPSLGAD